MAIGEFDDWAAIRKTSARTTSSSASSTSTRTRWRCARAEDREAVPLERGNQLRERQPRLEGVRPARWGGRSQIEQLILVRVQLPATR